MVATVAMQIDKRMLEKINRRLRTLPDDFGPVMDRALLATEGSLKKEGPRDTGTGQRGFRHSRPMGRDFNLEGEVTNNLIHMAVLDVGRKPGARPPPPAALAGWARRHGWTGSLWLLARIIGKKGWKTKRGRKHRGYVKRALKAASKDIDNIISVPGVDSITVGPGDLTPLTGVIR